MNITPYGKNILIKPIEKKGILASDVGSLCDYGVVTAVGSDVSNIKINDTIAFLIFGVNSITIDKEKYYFIPETDDFILGKIDIGVVE